MTDLYGKYEVVERFNSKHELRSAGCIEGDEDIEKCIESWKDPNNFMEKRTRVYYLKYDLTKPKKRV